MLTVSATFNLPTVFTHFLLALVLTWITERPGPVHIAYVRRDAHRQDAVQQGDEATVPLVAPGPINAA